MRMGSEKIFLSKGKSESREKTPSIFISDLRSHLSPLNNTSQLTALRSHLYPFSLLYIFLVLSSLIISPVIAGQISDISSIAVGARALGLGRAYAGIYSDVDSLFINPSGIAGIKAFKLNSMRASLLSDINFTSINFANPYDFGNLGVGIIYSQIPQIPLTRWIATGNGLNRPETYGYTDYSSGVGILSYAAPLKTFFKNDFAKDISIGANVKYFMQGFSSDSGSLEGASGSGTDMDLGVHWVAKKWIDFGASISNILPSSLGGKFVWKKNNVEEGIPASLKAGAKVKLLGDDALRGFVSHEAIFLFDFEKSLSGSKPMLFHTGIEWKPINIFALRLGLDQQEGASANKTEVESNPTYGIGLKLAPFTFDYSYHKYGELSENSTHYFSFGYVKEDNPHVTPSIITTDEAAPLTPQQGKVFDFLKDLFKDE